MSLTVPDEVTDVVVVDVFVAATHHTDVAERNGNDNASNNATAHTATHDAIGWAAFAERRERQATGAAARSRPR